MPNLRIIHDNAADRATTLAASSTAGAYAVSRVQNDYKGQWHRSTDTSVTYTLTWDDGEQIGGLGLPASNLSADATARVRLYSDVAGANLIADSGAVYACPGEELGLWNWSQPINGNAFAYGGLAKSAVWFEEQYFAKRCVIDLVDALNPAGYIDCARLVLGPYWQPQNNHDYGFVITAVDTSEAQRNDAGDNLSDAGTAHDELTFDLKYMPEADRAELMRILRRVGTSRNIFVSLLPNFSSPVAEQDHMGYFKRDNEGVTGEFYRSYSNRWTLKGW
jgi:hypothetical protein